jgi:hypothetical protein
MQLHMIAIAPWLSYSASRAHEDVGQPTQPGKLITYYISLIGKLSTIADVLPLASPAGLGAKMRTGGCRSFGRRVDHLHQMCPGPALFACLYFHGDSLAWQGIGYKKYFALITPQRRATVRHL